MSYVVYRKNSVTLAVTITDDDDIPVNLTGCEIYFYAASSIEKTVGNGITIVAATRGRIEVTLEPEDTDLKPGYYDSEILVVDVEGNRWSSSITPLLIKNNLSHLKEVE